MFIWRTYGCRSLASIFRQIVEARDAKQRATSSAADSPVVVSLDRNRKSAAQ